MLQDTGKREWIRCGINTCLPVHFWVCGREGLKEFDRIGYRSFFLLLLGANFTLTRCLSARKDLRLSGTPRENRYPPGTSWGLRCRCDWGEALTYHWEGVSFPRPWEIIRNKQQNGAETSGRSQGIYQILKLYISTSPVTCFNSLSTFYVLIWLLSLV